MTNEEKFAQCWAAARDIVAARRAEAPAGCDPLNSWVAVAVGVTSAAVGAYSAYSSNKSADKRQQQLLGAQPNGQQDYEHGLKLDMRYAPKFAAQNWQLSSQYSPMYAALASDIYARQAPRIAGINMATLESVDPESIYGRKHLYDRVDHDLSLGTALDPQLLMESEQAIRGAQAARGNVLGNAPVAAEALHSAHERQGIYQQRLDNMSRFLAGPTPESHFAELLGGGASAVSAGAQSVYQPYSSQSSGAQTAGAIAGLKQRDYNNYASALSPAGQVNPWAAATASLAGSGTAYLQGRANAPTNPYGGTYTGMMDGPNGYQQVYKPARA